MSGAEKISFRTDPVLNWARVQQPFGDHSLLGVGIIVCGTRSVILVWQFYSLGFVLLRLVI